MLLNWVAFIPLPSGMKLSHWKVDKLTDDIADVQAEMKDLWNTKWCHSKRNDAPGWRANFKNGVESICFQAMTCAPQEIQAALAATSGLDTGATDEAEAELQALYAQQSQKEAEEAIGICGWIFFGFCVAWRYGITGNCWYLRPWPSSRVVEEYLLPLPPHQLVMLHLQPKRLPWLLELRLDGGCECWAGR